MSKLMGLVAQYVEARDAIDHAGSKEFKVAKTCYDELAQQVAALEESKRALDWLAECLTSITAKYEIVPEDNGTYSLVRREHGDLYGDVIGTGPTPLAAVLDAMRKEGK